MITSLVFTALLAATPPSGAALRAGAATAIGYDRLRAAAGLHLRGTFGQAGATGSIDVTVALATGYAKQTSRTGTLAVTSGFDGASWIAQDGVVTIDDLPGDVDDAATTAWLARDGEADAGDRTTVSAPRRIAESGTAYDVAVFVPPGGSPVELWFDAGTHLIARSVFATDGGSFRTDYHDYRRVDGIEVAFAEHDVDPTGAATDTALTEVTLLPTLAREAIARPAGEDLGRVSGPSPAVVPFVSDIEGAEGHIAVPITLDGKAATVDFDSGGANALVPEAASRIGLATTGGVDVGGVGNGSEIARTARVMRLAIGGAHLADQPFLVLALPFAVVHPRANLSIDGLVGFELLAHFRTRVDYGRHELSFTRFEEPPLLAAGAVVLPFRSDGHAPFVEAAIDGVSGLFEIDTGANSTVTVFDTFARAHGLFARGGTTYVSAGGIGGAIGERLLRARDFTLAGVRLDAPVVSVSQTSTGAFASRTIAGNIGSGVLSRFRLTFDYRARTVTFEPVRDARAPFVSDGTGLGVTALATGSLSVLSVAMQSPAAAAGLLAGDRVVAIDGRAGDARTLDTFLSLRGGTRPFTLTVRRRERTFEVRIVPRDLLGAPQ